MYHRRCGTHFVVPRGWIRLALGIHMGCSPSPPGRLARKPSSGIAFVVLGLYTSRFILEGRVSRDWFQGEGARKLRRRKGASSEKVSKTNCRLHLSW